MPSLMGYLKQSEFSRLLSCLDYSYNCALAFDSRPGLKFLIQKVAGLEQAANLYRQAGAAWAIKLVALFEYCLAAIKRNHLSTNDVKKLLENSQTNVDPDLYSVFNKFRKSYNELCKTYVDVVLNNHNMTSPTQEKLERPLFFLIASQDDRALEDDMKDRNHNQNRFTNKKKEEPQTPFFLSDFSKQLNCDDSDGMSELNRDECGENLIDRKNEETQIDIPYNGPGKLHPSTEVINVGKIENKNFDETNLMIDDSMIKILKEYKRKKKNYSEPQKITVKNIQEQLVPPEIELQRRHSFLKVGRMTIKL